jgi:hypothetical protein
MPNRGISANTQEICNGSPDTVATKLLNTVDSSQESIARQAASFHQQSIEIQYIVKNDRDS